MAGNSHGGGLGKPKTKVKVESEIKNGVFVRRRERRDYLGSKRGVKSGVAPIITEESSRFLAGVTSGFLLDLHTHTHRRAS